MAAFDDERGRQRDNVARGADQHAFFVAADKDVVGAGGGAAGARLELDAGHQAEIAHVGHMRAVAQAVDRVLEVRREFGRAVEQPLVAIDAERGERGGAGQRMAGIGVAVEQFDQVFRPAHHGVVDIRAHRDPAHGHGRVGQPFGHRHDVGSNVETLAREGRAEAAEPGDHLVEDEQYAVAVADRAQALQIPLRRNQHAGGAGHGLDDDGGDGARAIERDQVFQRVGALGAPCGLAAAEGVALRRVGVREMGNVAEQVAELPPVVGDAADRQAAETDAVIAARPADQHGALRLARRLVIGQRNLQRGIDRFGPRVDEEHVVEIAGQQGGDARRQLELQRMPHLERGRIVHAFGLGADRLHDLGPPVAGVDAPQAGGSVEYAAAVGRAVMHPPRRFEQARRGLELAIGRKGHPQRFEVVRRGGARARVHGFHVSSPVSGAARRAAGPAQNTGVSV